MALGKMLNLGGIDNRPPKANQSTGRFRVARNVYPTPDGRIIPRYDYGSGDTLPLDTVIVNHITQYDSDKLYFTAYSESPFVSAFTRLLKNGVAIPSTTNVGYEASYQFVEDYSQSVQSYRRNNTMYFFDPYVGILLKYDGVEATPASIAQPSISSSSYNATGTKWVKVVNHSIDFDNNEPISESVTFPVLAATTNVNIAGETGGTGVIGLTNVEPAAASGDKIPPMTGFKCTATYDAINEDFPITITSGSITGTVGSYVIVAKKSSELVPYGFSASEGVGLALRIKSVSPFVLDRLGAKILSPVGEWSNTSISTVNGVAAAAAIVRGGKEFTSIWASSSKTGVYFFQGFIFKPIDVADASTIAIANPPVIVAGSDSVIATLGPILNDIYDVTSVKTSLNVVYNQSAGERSVGMATYQDLLLLYTKELIYFSDTSLGGSFEQGNAVNVMRVGDSSQGRVTSVAGTQDFFVVCRERQNYYVTGNIATGNYRVQEVVGAEIGAWSNSCAINIKDSVIVMSAIGVFQVMSGGRSELLSVNCPKNFSTYDANNINEDVSFRLVGFNSDLDGIGGSIAVAYDEFRELLVFMQKNAANSCLVLHTKTGEFYEWDGMMVGYPTQKASTIAFMYGEYVLGGVIDLGTGAGAQSFKENSALIPSYRETHPVKLYSTWLTGGEPSLEKQLLQLKLFGRIETSGTSKLQVAHYKDWNINTKITSIEYAPTLLLGSINDQVQYSHKQRLNSDKVLAASVGIELNSGQATFEIESFEVEFNSIQEGMKK